MIIGSTQEVRRIEGCLLSIVVPIFNEEENIPLLYERIRGVVDSLSCRYELILIDDGSVDDSLPLLMGLSERDPCVTFVSFTRNFGQYSAISAGLELARGDAVVVIDADLQDPPEAIPEMLERWEEGYDIVYGRRLRRDKEPVTKKASSFLFNRLMHAIADVDFPVDTSDFRLMDSAMVRHLNGLQERERFLRAQVAWLGGRTTEVEYDREPRHAGKTNYTFARRLKLSLVGIMSFSSTPLRIMSLISFFIFMLSVIAALVVFIQRVFFGLQVPGMAFLVIAVCLLGGFQLLFLGLLGEYLSRIYTEVKGRPVYLVSRRSDSRKEEDGRSGYH